MRPISLTFIPRVTLKGIMEQSIGTMVKNRWQKESIWICKEYIVSDQPNFLPDKLAQDLGEKAVVNMI